MDIVLPIILIILALVFFCLEVVLPSLGTLTISGLVLGAAGVFYAFSIDTFYGWCTLTLGIIGMPIAYYLGFRFLKASPMVLSSTVGEPPLEEKPLPRPKVVKLGERGIATTDIRPMGRAKFGDVGIEVASSGEIIPSGKAVEITEIYGQRVIVRAAIESSGK